MVRIIAHTAAIYVKAALVGECAIINPRFRMRIDLGIGKSREINENENIKKGKKKFGWMCVDIMDSGWEHGDKVMDF